MIVIEKKSNVKSSEKAKKNSLLTEVRKYKEKKK